MFLDGNSAIFQNAYPAIAKSKDGYILVENASIKVLPATAVSSKVQPGFLSAKGHGVFDTLIDGFCAQQFNHPYDPSSIKALEDKADGRVEAYSCLYSNINNQYRRHEVINRLLTRVGINRSRATAAEDILYSIEVLNESFRKESHKVEWGNYVYRSAIFVSDESLANKLTKFIQDNSHTFTLGGSASRGLGKVEISATTTQINNDISNRIKKFNQHFQKRYKMWSQAFVKKPNKLIKERIFFTIDLQADAILTNNWQHTTVITPNMLQEFAEVEDSSLKLHAAYSNYDYRSGWNSAWGLMKDVELVTTKGSVYLFSIANFKLWQEALTKLEICGVGERTNEGFGQVEICNEFHQVFREKAV